MKIVGDKAAAGVWDRYRLLPRLPRTHVLHDAAIEPASPFREGTGMLEKANGGVVCSDGAPFVPAFGVRGGHMGDDDYVGGGHVSFRPTPGFDVASCEEQCEEAIFGGFLYTHFGHCFMESFSRLWDIARHRPDMPVLFLTERRDGPDLLAWHQSLFGLAGVDPARIRLVTRPIRVATLVVAEPLLRLWSHAFPSALAAQREIVQNRLAEHFSGRELPHLPERVYFSRANVKLAITLGEKFIERYMREQGWDIVYPEDIDTYTQLYLMTNAPEIAAVSGSAIHQIMFRSKPLAIYYLNRFSHIVQDYVMVDDMVGTNATYFLCNRKTELPPHEAEGPFLLDLPRLLDHLEAEIPDMKPGILRNEARDEQAVLDVEYHGYWHLQTALIHLGGKRDDEAIRCIDEAIRSAPKNRRFLAEKISILVHLGRIAEAREHCEAVIRDGETARVVMEQYFQTIVRLSKHKEGGDFLRSIGRGKTFYEATKMAILYYNGGAPDLARAYARWAASITCDNLDDALQLINISSALSLHDEVIRLAPAALAATRSPYALRALVLAYALKARADDALAVSMDNLDVFWNDSIEFLFSLIQHGHGFASLIIRRLDGRNPEAGLAARLEALALRQ